MKEGFTLLPNLENHKCFGCSPSNPSGLQMKFYNKGEAVYSWVTVPEHLCGWHNLAHGGAISAMLDEIMGRTAVYILNKLIMTKSMNVEFLKPVLVGQEMRVEGRVFEVTNDREALMEGLVFNEKEVLCARASGKFALFTPEILKRMGIMDPNLIDGLKRLFSR